MWKPDESLDEYMVSPAPEVTSEPPRSVSLRRTGDVEVLVPINPPEVKPVRRAFRSSSSLQPLWFRRFLAVGSGALVMMALVLVSAILVGINDPVAGPEVATSVIPDEMLVQPQEPLSFDVFSPSTFAPATGGVHVIRSSTRRRTARPSIHIAAHKPRRQFRPLPQPEQPTFVPTTLVIYAENGVVYSRIEPWSQAEDKKTPPTYNE